MRYINLHKRNISKFQFLAKRIASVSILCLIFTTVIVVPLTLKANDMQLKQDNNIIEIDNENNNEYLGNDTIDVDNSLALSR